MSRLCIHSTRIISTARRQCRSFSFAPSLASHQIARPIPARQPGPFAPASRSVTHNTSQNATEESYKHTIAQISRAASQAIRVAIREGNRRDALYVVNSALQMPREPWVNLPAESRRLINPMDFGRPVPTRLVTHTLIHTLLRENQATTAGREVQKLLAIGVRVHFRTLEASVGLLSKPSHMLHNAKSPRVRTVAENHSKSDWKARVKLQKESARLLPETRLALDLLFAARQSRRRRTERMCGWVVDACLLQGEIFVATLLFVILVKDWQLRQVIKSSPVEPEQTSEDNNRSVRHLTAHRMFHVLGKQQLAKQIGVDIRRVDIPYPEKTILQRIINAIDQRLFSSDLPNLGGRSRSDGEKSLLYLANLIDQRILPFGQLSPLIRALYSCAPSQNKAHLIGDPYTFHANVYDYCHEVLLRLCKSMPSERPSPSHVSPEVLPPLDTRAYNALLHYALRHRMSPALADAIIYHMTVHRTPPLQPDITTYNILLHSASVLRHSGLADRVLNTLHNRFRPRALSVLPPETRSLSPHRNSSGKGGNFLRHINGLNERPTVPVIPTIANNRFARLRPVHVDVHTICTYVTHLVRTGRPEIVADVIFHIIPELHIVNHPATSPSAYGEFSAPQSESMRRAIAYGPRLYCVLLNALEKANKTGLAERLWLLARKAERASWFQQENEEVLAPWCLPIQAYTSMMKCYSNESGKGAALIRGSRYHNYLSASLSLRQGKPLVWKPQKGGRVYVKGWALFYLKMKARERGYQSAEPPLRWQTAREVGYLLFKSMRNGALSVWQELMVLHSGKIRSFLPQRTKLLNSLQFPVMDARFFNSILDILGRRIRMQARRIRASPSWWNRKLRIAQKLYGESGWTCTVYDHTLVEVARYMTQAGYNLPIGLQRAIVGRDVTPVFSPANRREVDVRPFAFPKPTNLRHRMFSLKVTKSRGLPVGRRRPETMRNRRVEARRQTKSQ